VFTLDGVARRGQAACIELPATLLPPRNTLSSETARENPLPGSVPSGARILARSFYRELRSNGYTPAELVAVSTELIELVTQELRSDRETVKTAA
jgi:hypothetical protein